MTQLRAWNQLAIDIAANAKRGPTVSARLYALTNQALYDAWAAFDAAATGLRLDLQANGLPPTLRWPAMATAAAAVLQEVGRSLYGGSAGVLPQALSDRLQALLAQGVSQAATNPGLAPWLSQAQQLGQQVAQAVLSAAASDGANQAGNYADTTGYQPQPSGFTSSDPSGSFDATWQPLSGQKALTPQWGQITPFALLSGDALRPEAVLPARLADGSINPAFQADVDEVLQMSRQLTAAQKATVEYWEQGNGTGYPPGQWLAIGQQLIASRQLNLDQAVKLSFSLSQALGDAAIAAWDSKYAFNTVRPITAIRQLYWGQTISDWRNIPILGQEWRPYQRDGALTPPFPDVPSGHSTFSAAASSVLRNLLGSNSYGGSATLADGQATRSFAGFEQNGFDGLPGEGPSISLSWSSLSGAAEDAGLSRLLGGIHMREGNAQGLKLGISVGQAVLNRASGLFGEAPLAVVATQFGSMDADVLTGQLSAGQSGLQLFGFDGDDLLIAGGEAGGRLELFGGLGADTFRIQSGAAALVRDYQAGERLELSANSALPLQIASDASGLFTEVRQGEQLLVSLDGQWRSDQLGVVLV